MRVTVVHLDSLLVSLLHRYLVSEEPSAATLGLPAYRIVFARRVGTGESCRGVTVFLSRQIPEVLQKLKLVID